MRVKILRRQQVADARLPEGLHPVLKRVYAGRGVRSGDELEYRLARLHPYNSFTGIDRAVGLLEKSLAAGERIIIIGDFDTDGASATALAFRALRAFGAGDVHYLVPNRFEYGYGLTPAIVALAAKRSPDLIITVDNGISSFAGVAAARAAGIKVLVTDHHLPGTALPEADALLNPNLPGDSFPSKSLAGVGVVFYLMAALRARLREQRWFIKRGLSEPRLAEYLDLVALGTVADLVPLDRNNRILVAQGLKRIRAGHCVPGIRALAECGRRDPACVLASDLGFAVAPRLNAAGRLDDMSLGIECLLADDPDAALALAARLDELNRERRNIEARMQEEAQAIVAAMGIDESETDFPSGICMFEESWHQGVVGLVASRIKERLHRPVIAFARAGENLLKGSARSVPGLNIRDALAAVHATHPALVEKFGGHAMAAGLSLPANHYAAFAEAFDAEVRRWLEADDFSGVWHTDGELSAADLSLELVELLRAAGPWGQAFPEPLFDGEFSIHTRRVVGRGHLKLVLGLDGSTQPLDAIAFDDDGKNLPGDCTHVRSVYRPEINDYGGMRRVQLILQHLEPR